MYCFGIGRQTSTSWFRCIVMIVRQQAAGVFTSAVRARTNPSNPIYFSPLIQGAPFVGDHVNDDNLLQKGRPLVKRLQQQSDTILCECVEAQEKAMTYNADLTGSPRVRLVGYLARGHHFATGTTSGVFFDRLVRLVERPLGFWCGYHTCDLGKCDLSQVRAHPEFRYRNRVIGIGSTDIFVPDDEVVHSAPSLILHYICRHQYLPPSCFVKAVLNCPEPGSQEYSAAVKRIAPEVALLLGIR